MKIKYILFFFFLFPALVLQSQERQGFTMSRYGGMNGLSLNPSFGMLTPFQLEVGWSMAAMNLDNFFLDIPSARVDQFLFGTGEHPVRLINHPAAGFSGEAIFRFPAVGVKFKRFAVSTVANRRLVMGFEHFPTPFMLDIFNGFDPALIGTQKEIPRFHGGYLLWEEAGANFSAVLQQYENDRINGGISLRYVHGASGSFFSTSENSIYKYADSTHLDLEKMQAYYGQNGEKYGAGLVFDIGLHWMKQDTGKVFRSVDSPDRVFDHKYKYHFGISFLDVGMIRFFEAEESNIQVNNLPVETRNGGPFTVDSMETIIFDLLDRIDSAGTSATIQQSTAGTMDMRLPTAVSAQFDWQFHPNFFLGSTFTYGLPVGKIPSVRRPAQLTLAPRYETGKFMLMLPMSFYDFRQARVGAALRFKGITVGTDRVFTYTENVTSLKGFDFYVGVRLGIEQLEHTFLKPYKPVKEKNFEHTGYTDRLAALPGQGVQLYFSMHPDSGSLLVLSNFAGDTIDSTFVDPVQQRARFWRPWKYGYGYRNVKRYKIPKELPSDVYFLERETPLIVRPTSSDSMDIIIVIPTNTYESENKKGGRSLYAADKAGRKGGNVVSFLRPFDQQYFKQLQALNAWMKEHPEYKVGYISDKEMDSYHPIKTAKMLIIAGESRSWTRAARSNYDRFVKKGGHVLVLSSDDFMKYQVRYKQKGKQLVCYKNNRKDLFEPNPLNRTGEWKNPKLKYPLPAYRRLVYGGKPAAADSTNRLNLSGLSERAAVFDLRNEETVAGQMKSMKYKPPVLAQVVFRDDPQKPATLVKDTPASGMVFDFHSAALLIPSTPAEKQRLKTAIDFLLAQ